MTFNKKRFRPKSEKPVSPMRDFTVAETRVESKGQFVGKEELSKCGSKHQETKIGFLRDHASPRLLL